MTTQTCNVCGYTGTDRNNHDCSAVMQGRIAGFAGHMLKLREVVNSIRVPIGVRHKLPCECICCESNARIDEALRLIGEVL